MSDFPDAMTKQILSAPPRSMRSTKYSLTAHGRSAPRSSRLPTGRSSFEKASGWMRLPRPAAGMTPHMSGLQGFAKAPRVRMAGGLERGLERHGAIVGRVLGERTLASGGGDAHELSVRQVDRRDGLVGGA